MTTDARLSLTPEEIAIARSQSHFYDYALRVRGWEMRPHQVQWFSALQALGDGYLRHPEGGLGPLATCKRCLQIEAAWLKREHLPYDTGWSALCGTCRTTNKLLIIGFYSSGKSDTLIEWNEWMIGKSTVTDGIPQCGWVSYADNIASDRSVAVRDTVDQNQKFRIVFPNCTPAKKKGWSESSWFVSRSDPGKKDPTFFAAGINASILGARFQTAVTIDDPQDPNEAMKSATYRDDTWRTLVRVVQSRTAIGTTPQIISANRWAEDDVPGRIMDFDPDFAIIRTPALDEDESSPTYDQSVFPPETWQGTPIGNSTEELHKLRERDRPAFLTGYMCQPPSQEGDLFQHFAEGEINCPVTKTIQFWDTTTTEKTSSDFNSMTELRKLSNGRSFVGKVLNFKRRPTETIDIMLAEYWRADEEGLNPLIVIENAQAGPMFVEWLQKYAGVRVRAHDPGGHGKGSGKRGPRDLFARAVTAVSHFDGGIIFFPRGWVTWKAETGGVITTKEEAQIQMKAYGPHARGHDDIVSSMVGAVEFLYPLGARGTPKAPFALGRFVRR